MKKVIFSLFLLYLLNGCGGGLDSNGCSSYKSVFKLSKLSIDINGDDNFETVYNYYYDSNAKLQKTEAKVIPTGLIHTTTYEYIGNKQIEKTDINSDDTIDFTQIYEYDNNKNLIKKTEYNHSLIEEISYYKYDKDNRVIEIKFDRGGDGIIDRVTTFEYIMVSKNQDKKIEYEDGWFESYTLFTYDNNRKLKEEATYNKFGALREKIFYEYDIYGNIGKKIHTFNDRTFDYIYYNYDKYGNKIEKKEDLNGDGVIDRVEKYEYQKFNVCIN